MLSVYYLQDYKELGLDKFLQRNDFPGAINAAKLSLAEANEHYHATVEPGDGINTSMDAGLAIVIKYEHLIKRLEKEYEKYQSEEQARSCYLDGD